MAILSSISYTASGGATNISGVVSAASGDLGTSISVLVPANTTNQTYTTSVTVADLQSVFISTTGNLTMKTNSTATPAQTFTFVANNPLAWTTGAPVANPLNTNITTIYWTNATNTDITVSGFILQQI